MPLVESAQWIGLFGTYLNPGYSRDEVNAALDKGLVLADLPGVVQIETQKNILMASQKLAMAGQVYPKIERLVITSQTTSPSDTETAYSGTIYTSVDADEYYRTGNTNPYQVVWNIASAAANGAWGSYICIDALGQMINRALTGGVTKSPGSNIIVEFTGSVI